MSENLLIAIIVCGTLVFTVAAGMVCHLAECWAFAQRRKGK